ncbi:MAG: hypothetical protein V4654_10300 [Bdellovibrionota bacterium]
MKIFVTIASLFILNLSTIAFANESAKVSSRIVYGIGNPNDGGWIYSSTAIAALEDKCWRNKLSKISCENLYIKNTLQDGGLRNAVICTGLCRD